MTGAVVVVLVTELEATSAAELVAELVRTSSAVLVAVLETTFTAVLVAGLETKSTAVLVAELETATTGVLVALLETASRAVPVFVTGVAGIGLGSGLETSEGWTQVFGRVEVAAKSVCDIRCESTIDCGIRRSIKYNVVERRVGDNASLDTSVIEVHAGYERCLALANCLEVIGWLVSTMSTYKSIAEKRLGRLSPSDTCGLGAQARALFTSEEQESGIWQPAQMR
ncbi:hypothetical protein BC830DRAFT_1086020 [Chytriomyces sp. MP71]|nr:hypothetical protein BC830DRAFT_1086020 [Chytriomyces sp. MP71]